jgi:hypothetical protein
MCAVGGRSDENYDLRENYDVGMSNLGFRKQSGIERE